MGKKQAQHHEEVTSPVRAEPQKKKRGKTMMKTFSLSPNERVEVEFNDRGQPIGPTSKQLSSYLGTIAREMVPVTFPAWKKVDKELKKDLWICIQSRFTVDEPYKHLLLKMVGVRWRESKSKLVTAIRSVASTCPEPSSRLAMLRPENVENVADWNDFVKEKLSEKFTKTSQKFKELREKNKIPHTMSRMGYARLAEAMRKESGKSDISRDELWVKAHTKKNGDPPNSIVADCITKIQDHNSNTDQNSPLTTSVNGDGVSALFGNEHKGRVRGLGFGVAPAHLAIYASSSKKVGALQNQVTRLEARLDEVTNLLMTKLNGKVNDIVSDKDPHDLDQTTQSHHRESHRDSNNVIPDHTTENNLVKRKCKLLNWKKNIVAEGTIASVDPNSTIHFVKLGPDAWKVWVNAAVEPKATLFTPNSEMSTIEQAVGSTVAWPKIFISLV